MNQFIIGSMLGLELMVDHLKFTPCYPEDWPSVSLNYRFKTSTYNITIFQEKNIEESWWKMDNEQGTGDNFLLQNDGLIHEVEIHILI